MSTTQDDTRQAEARPVAPEATTSTAPVDEFDPEAIKRRAETSKAAKERELAALRADRAATDAKIKAKVGEIVRLDQTIRGLTPRRSPTKKETATK